MKCDCEIIHSLIESIKTPGRWKNPLYKTWQCMIRRVLNPKAHNYKYYGGRGIGVCKEWAEDFYSFEKVLKGKKAPGKTLNRINNNGHYCPHNVTFSTQVEQVLNRRVSGSIKHRGVHQRKGSGKFTAGIWIEGKRYTIGTYDTIEKAFKEYSMIYHEWYGHYPTKGN